MEPYAPSETLLKRYADVLVNFALGGGKGIRRGDVVFISGAECAKPLIFAARNAALEAGGHVLLDYHPDEDGRFSLSRDFFERATPAQLDFFPQKYFRGLVDQIDQLLFILGTTDPHALRNIDPEKIMRRGVALKPWRTWRQEKEHQGKLHWTIALWGTPQMAKEAHLSPKAYWRQIADACFLGERRPIAKWREIYRAIAHYNRRLNALSPRIDTLHVEGPDADLWIRLGEKRKWLSGRGANIPSFEIFTSPDWRGTEGWIHFNQPLYRYSTLIEGVELHFRKGKVVKSSATKGGQVLHAMLNTPGADRVGEFSLTDRRHSRITKFMAETLFDENRGGAQGNTHLALGSAFAETYAGDVRALTAKDKVRLGFNDSSIHTDIVSTARRRVTAHLKNGATKVIYANGQFTL